MSLYKHQLEAIEKANEGKNYVITTGTGSGKSLTYIIPIIEHIFNYCVWIFRVNWAFINHPGNILFSIKMCSV